MQHLWHLPEFSEAYREPIRFSLIQQVPVAILFGLTLDCGSLGRICTCAVAGYWVGAGVCLAKRAGHPTATDLRFLRWGFFPLLVAALALGALRIRGQ